MAEKQRHDLFSVKILYFLTHPIQYQSPLLRQIVSAGIDLHVVYASDRTARAFFDKGYGREFKWDVPLLEGYPSTALGDEEPANLWRRRVSDFAPLVRTVIHQQKPDVVWVHGWANPFALAAWREGVAAGLPVMMRGDTFLGSIRGGFVKRLLHRLIYTRRFKQVSVFLAVGALNEQLYLTYGAAPERVFVLPHAVDNQFFEQRAKAATPQREELRRALGIEAGRPILFFCGRLSDDKDPGTLIRAVGRFAQTGIKPMVLMAGDGPLRSSLEKLAQECAPDCVQFLGFQNQTELPALYDLCDIFVLPSAFEPWGLVVNEVMNAGKPVITSDKTGCWPDLVKPGRNGDVFSVGSVDDLCAKLQPWLIDADLRSRGGSESLRIIQSWNYDEDVVGLKRALEFLKCERAVSL